MCVHVLLVEDNDGDAYLIERKLSKATTKFKVQRVEWLASAFQVVENSRPDVVLLDLSLPDSQGVDTVLSFTKQAPGIPIVVMTGQDDMAVAMNAVRVGAQDYLIKGEVDGRHLERTLVLAMERKRLGALDKRLLHTSLTQAMPQSDSAEAALAMLRGYVPKLAEAVVAVEEYVRKNAPAHAEDVKTLLDGYNVPLVLREVRAIFSLGEGTGRKRQVSVVDMAAVGVDAITKKRGGTDRPSDLPGASLAVLEAIERRTRVLDA